MSPRPAGPCWHKADTPPGPGDAALGSRLQTPGGCREPLQDWDLGGRRPAAPSFHPLPTHLRRSGALQGHHRGLAAYRGFVCPAAPTETLFCSRGQNGTESTALCRKKDLDRGPRNPRASCLLLRTVIEDLHAFFKTKGAKSPTQHACVAGVPVRVGAFSRQSSIYHTGWLRTTVRTRASQQISLRLSR